MDNRDDDIHLVSEITSDYFYSIVIDPDGSYRLDWLDGAFERVTGIAREDIQNLDYWTEIINPDDLPLFEAGIRNILANEPSIVEYRIFAKPKEERWVRDYAHPIWNEKDKRVDRVIGAVQDITKHKQTEDALRASEKRLELAIEGAGIGYWDQNFLTNEIIRSKYWTEMLGYSPEEISSDTQSWKALIHQDDLPEVNRIANDHENGRTPFFKVEHRMKTKSGKWKWILNWGKVVRRDVNGKPIRATGIHLDITKLKQAEAALRESEERYRAVVEQSRDAMFLVDIASKRIMEANPALETLIGYSHEELLGITLYDFFDHGESDIDEKIQLILDNKVYLFGEQQCSHKDGSQVTVEIYADLIKYNGKEVICLVSRDVTARKKAEEERQKLETHLQEIQKLESLGILAGGIAHDFNNLLVGVLGNASLALEKLPPTSPVRELVSQIEKSGRRSAELSKQLLAYSGKRKYRKYSIDLSELVEDMIDLCKVSISKKRISGLISRGSFLQSRPTRPS